MSVECDRRHELKPIFVSKARVQNTESECLSCVFMFTAVSCGQRKMLVVAAKMAVAATGCLCPRRQHLVCDLGAQSGGGIEAAVASTYTHISFAVSGKLDYG